MFSWEFVDMKSLVRAMRGRARSADQRRVVSFEPAVVRRPNLRGSIIRGRQLSREASESIATPSSHGHDGVTPESGGRPTHLPGAVARLLEKAEQGDSH